jgi:hypothetical protein
VAAVVGTLLALLVFFALFGIFLTEYLPLWMTDNESEFTAQSETALANFKSNIDAQGDLGGPSVYATSFPLSSDGVPLLAQPTQGKLILLPPTCPSGFGTPSGKTYQFPVNTSTCVFETESFSAQSGTTYASPWNQTTTTALVEMELPNRYYTSQTFFFEDDAVIQTEYGAHSSVIGPPPLTLTKTARNLTVTTSFVGLYGNSTVAIGVGSEEVYTHLISTSRTTSNGLFLASNRSSVPFTFTFEIGTRNVCAWFTYLTQLVGTAGLSSSAYSLKWYQGASKTWSTASPGTTQCFDSAGYTFIVWLKIPNVSYASAVTSAIGVNMGVGAV